MGLIDSHAHLTFEPLRDRVGDVLDRATAAGVDRVISIATDLDDAERVLELARSDDRVAGAMGIHPHEAEKAAEEGWGRYERLMGDPAFVAIGEMGLDHHYDFADHRVQRTVFERQLALASGGDRPIIIHCREAHADAVAMLKAAEFGGRKVVFHCFTGTAAEAAEIAENGWRISFTGVVTFKNAGALHKIAADYPIDQLMVETDSPYLSPVPVRHVRPNEPAHVVHTARFIAELRGVSYEEIVTHTSANTRAFFGLG